jgi:pantothenate kinase
MVAVLTVPWSVPELVARARRLVVPGERRLLGLAGAPGAGKSTLAVALCDALGPVAARVPMDGFHLANQVLAGLGLADRKGSPPTFDAGGFHALLRRLRAADEAVVYAPEFHRELEEPIAGALPVAGDVPLVVVEGNYLLLADGPWRGTAELFDEVWFLRPDDEVRRRRLLLRHQSHGRTPEQALAWVGHNDDPNALLVAGTEQHADLVVGPEA